MKKSLIFTIAIFAILIAAFYYLLYPRLEIISGYNAKIMCSCLFVSKMQRAEVEEIDLGFGPLWMASNEVDTVERTIETSVWGFHPKKAIFREGLGCTLIHDADETEVKSTTLDRSAVQYGPEIWPGTEVIPEEKLREAIETGFDPPGKNVLNTRAILVVKSGKLIGEVYGEGFDMHSELPGWSMMKSVNSAIVGLLVKDGMLELDAPAPIDDWKIDARAEITLRHLLNMTSGLDWNEDYGSVSTATVMLYGTDNMGKYAATVPSAYPAGEKWYYSSGTSNILSMITAEAFDSKAEYRKYAFDRLFGPLGMKHFTVETDASGTFVGSSYGYGSARDWAKFALLYKNLGHWQGTQILDTSWVEFSKTPVDASNGKYAGQFWTNGDGGFENYGKDSYWLGGFQGKQVSVHPSEDLIVVRIGVTYDKEDNDFDRLIGNIIAAARDIQVQPEPAPADSTESEGGSTGSTLRN